jgi:hypothetical protein
MGTEYEAKRCKSCREIYPLSDFHKSKEGSKGVMAICRRCYNDKVRIKYNPLVRKSRKLKYKYGITLEDYNNKLKEQGDVCAICKSNTPGGNGGLYVDHNHTTGQVRGLLCHWCNFMIGQSKESPEILSAGIDYLKKWSSP